MIIKANFYTADEAEAAAAALRQNPEGIFDVTLDLPRAENAGEMKTPIGFFTNMSVGGVTGVPLTMYSGYNNGEESTREPHPGKASVQVICRPSAAKRVASALRSSGGQDIRS